MQTTWEWSDNGELVRSHVSRGGGPRLYTESAFWYQFLNVTLCEGE